MPCASEDFGCRRRWLALGRTQGKPDAGEWQFVKSVRNAWGKIPLTDSGRTLTGRGRGRDYVDRLAAQYRAVDPVSRCHHFVPRDRSDRFYTVAVVWMLRDQRL